MSSLTDNTSGIIRYIIIYPSVRILSFCSSCGADLSTSNENAFTNLETTRCPMKIMMTTDVALTAVTKLLLAGILSLCWFSKLKIAELQEGVLKLWSRHPVNYWLRQHRESCQLKQDKAAPSGSQSNQLLANSTQWPQPVQCCVSAAQTPHECRSEAQGQLNCEFEAKTQLWWLSHTHISILPVTAQRV